MSDLTRGSVTKHIFRMAAPVAITMLSSIAYQLIDIYFLAELGPAVVAGVSAAGSAGFLVLAFSEVLGIGTLALIAQALGRNDCDDGSWILNQAMALSALCGAITLIVVSALIYPYLQLIAADQPTVEAGVAFIGWVLPAFVAILPMAVLMTSLQGAGIVWPIIAANTLTVTMNAMLAPVLIAGWITHVPLGVRGAGMATSISVVVGTIIVGLYVQRSHPSVRLNWRLMWPQFRYFRRILTVGLPAGCEVALMFVLPAVVLYAIRDFGASSQAGYSIASRITQTILLPGMSVTFAVTPLVGQSLGAANGSRVTEVFRKAVFVGSAIMAVTSVLVHANAKWLVGFFDAGASATTVAIVSLRVLSLAFVAQGLVSICTSMFQGLGNTAPSLISSATYFSLLTCSVVWLSGRPSFRVEYVWYLMVAGLTLQALLSLWLLRGELHKRLPRMRRDGGSPDRSERLAEPLG